MSGTVLRPFPNGVNTIQALDRLCLRDLHDNLTAQAKGQKIIAKMQWSYMDKDGRPYTQSIETDVTTYHAFILWYHTHPMKILHCIVTYHTV
jgi:hypothetical protein